MLTYDIIEQKKRNIELTKEQIDFVINGYISNEIPSYQMSALLMAIYFNGMTKNETLNLTLAIKNSGKTLNFKRRGGVFADKHSTGGVGDKTSLVVAPILASCGVKVAKMSGRGLGHTGGTIDKLESINGFNTNLTEEEILNIIDSVGACIVAQNEVLAPADKLLYALRDVTATVDSIPLISSSIMGKKLAVDDDVIVLDVKTGSGAFLKTYKESLSLAKSMVDIGKMANKKIMAIISNMDSPLGRYVGNSLEVIEAIEVLNGKGDKDLIKLCVELSASVLNLGGYGNIIECRKLARNSIKNKNALNSFKNMIKMQGGDITLIEDTSKFKTSKYTYLVKSKNSGYIQKVNAEEYGKASLVLGAGRKTINDKIDLYSGIYINKKVGEYVSENETIATLFTNKKESIIDAEKLILNATTIGKDKPKNKKIIIKKVI